MLPETAWRFDQKEPAKRTAMAARALVQAFADAGCGENIEVRPFANGSAQLEQDRLAALSAEGIETAVFVIVEELGPLLAVTFSLPFLWSGWSEAQAHLRAIHIKTGQVLLDARIKRIRGGVFQLRPASWAEAEFEAAVAVLLRETSS